MEKQVSGKMTDLVVELCAEARPVLAVVQEVGGIGLVIEEKPLRENFRDIRRLVGGNIKRQFNVHLCITFRRYTAEHRAGNLPCSRFERCPLTHPSGACP